jgi:hypothetical protein
MEREDIPLAKGERDNKFGAILFSLVAGLDRRKQYFNFHFKAGFDIGGDRMGLSLTKSWVVLVVCPHSIFPRCNLMNRIGGQWLTPCLFRDKEARQAT